MKRVKNGLKTVVDVQLTGSERDITVKSTDGREVSVSFSSSGEIRIYADDSAVLKHN